MNVAFSYLSISIFITTYLYVVHSTWCTYFFKVWQFIFKVFVLQVHVHINFLNFSILGSRPIHSTWLIWQKIIIVIYSSANNFIYKIMLINKKRSCLKLIIRTETVSITILFKICQFLQTCRIQHEGTFLVFNHLSRPIK